MSFFSIEESNGFVAEQEDEGDDVPSPLTSPRDDFNDDVQSPLSNPPQEVKLMINFISI